MGKKKRTKKRPRRRSEASVCLHTGTQAGEPATAEPVRLSPKDFGAQRRPSVTRQAVAKAIEAGRLSDSVSVNDRGWKRIDVELGNAEWEAWTDRSKAEGGQAAPKGPKGAAATPSLFSSENDVEYSASRVTHSRASTERILVDAELKRLDLEMRRGSVVDREEVTRELHAMARTIRNGLSALPKRLASVLASMSDPADCHDALQTEIDAALANFVRILEAG